MKNKVFEKYSDYYDSIYSNKDYKKEVDFIINTLPSKSVKNEKILSLGCGTATYELLLAEKGASIVGVDMSKEMLEIGKNKVKNENLQDKIKLFQKDVRKLKYKSEFDIALCMFNVIGYQNTNEDLDKMLKGVSNALKKGGYFAFDCWHCSAVIKDPPGKRIKEFLIDNKKLVRKTNSSIDYTTDLISINFQLFEDSIKGKKVVDETHTMRYFSIPELKYFLSQNGLEFIEAYNFLDPKAKVSSDKWDTYLVAKKK